MEPDNTAYTASQLGSTDPGLSGGEKIGVPPVEGLLTEGGQPALTVMQQIRALARRAGATAASLTYGGSSNLSATNVEDALDELDAEKQPAGSYAPGSHVGDGGTDAHPLATETEAGFTSRDFTAPEKQKLAGLAEGGGTPDATTTVAGKAKASVAPDPATGPVFVGENDPRVRDRYGPVRAAATVFSGAQAANATLTSGDLRGVDGVPSDAKAVDVMVVAAASAAGQAFVLLDSADVTPTGFSPKLAYNGANFSSDQLRVPFGSGTNAGKIRAVIGSLAVQAAFAVYVVGWHR